MSLNAEQIEATKKELQANFDLLGYSAERIAEDLHTTPEKITGILKLNARKMEDPWILKIYLENEITANGKTPIEFSSLRGDYHDYWFLNKRRIKKQKIG